MSREINRDYAPVGSAAPDATQVGTIRATAAGAAAVTHTLTAGNTDGAWELDAATGELKLAAALDHETTARYHLIVEARSGPAAATPVPVTITVTPAG